MPEDKHPKPEAGEKDTAKPKGRNKARGWYGARPRRPRS